MRKTLLAAAAIGLSLTALYGSFAKYPYLQNQTESTMVVRWETPASESGLVQYGLSPAYGSEVVQPSPGTDHELTLTGLAPDTVYHYRAISGADTSADAAFHTPVPPSKPFRFFAFGDHRTDSADHQSVVNRMLTVDPAPPFALDVGDLTADGSTAAFATFFHIERGLMGRTVLFPVLGNHDIGNVTNWFRYFALPGNERWYTVRYGNSVFHCLDNYSTYTPGSTQYNWLVAALQADSADPAVRHIFIWFHEPPYSTNSGHGSNTTVRQYLCPLFEHYGVQLAFQGHNHCYEHSLVNGVHYIVTGGGGAPLYNTWDQAQSWTVYREATLEFVLVEVRGDTISCRGIRPDGSVCDSFSIVTPPAAVSEPLVESPVLPPEFSAAPTVARRRVQFTVTLAAPARTSVEVYDSEGRRVAVLTDAVLPAGRSKVTWYTHNAPAGSYYCVFRTGGATRAVSVVRTP